MLSLRRDRVTASPLRPAPMEWEGYYSIYDDDLPAMSAVSDKFMPFAGQIAGHHTEMKNGVLQVGFLKELENHGWLLKPAQDGKRGQREIGFYEELWNSLDVRFDLIKMFIPNFKGMRTVEYGGEAVRCLEIEDITYKYKMPASIDIKIGKRTYGPDASAEKIRKESGKYPPQETKGFRILGYKIAAHHDLKRERSREWGISLAEEELIGALEEFVAHREDASEVATEIVRQLCGIRAVSESGLYHFYSSSVLICYEADKNRRPSVDIRMIDFSHVHDGKGEPDNNYLFGLNNLIDMFSTIAGMPKSAL